MNQKASRKRTKRVQKKLQDEINKRNGNGKAPTPYVPVNWSKMPISEWDPNTKMKSGFYRIPKNSIYRYIDNKLYSGLVEVGQEAPAAKTGICSIKIPKLSREMVNQIHSFFQLVYEKYSTEAVVLLWYHFDKHIWNLEVPTQEVSGASVSYERDDKEVKQLEKDGFTLVGSIHSHGQMGAFHSGTDDEDEYNFDGLHITIGRVNTGPEYACRFIMKDMAYKLEPHTCMDIPVQQPVCPEQWLSKVKQKTYKKTTVIPYIQPGLPNMDDERDAWWRGVE